ncbi:MAG: succinate dehydrogenase, cytochrome b556 subunit [Gammaproteobacteria bacterium]|jgi:succinate dehydrogenase / fumarate reductase cytochrome b subunit|nr:succinate dehydrogenase, cytochrome b556 subunit [Gammaproteobacteria bacterium]MBT4607104.1 succinate dehydrogenase, cytochrome b556 subunit [Thiotrichales bacterium]MBT3473518.1 succinate dehydrogenase, cytochrome b556 subunit [Gammaproteobacteria bacterium]MBT3968548.1 succinate dehydrogenase, cytochrome b556 subunit [Gammaproteobacteria bacterium]MBT4080231.1 succinate dehydrogenase, cytochrome b556 subunit [Gammaproteobacteria bacterium]
MTAPTKPLSPHLSIYRPQLTSVLSILHRTTGVLLAIGTLLVCYWLFAVLSGPETFATAQQLFSSWFGKLILIGWSWAAFYHLSNGIRHLCWDLGLGFELRSVYWSGYSVLVISLLLTLALWSIS